MTFSYRQVLQVLTLFLVETTIALSQSIPRVTISGTVYDDSTSAVLESVDVFIASSSWGSGSDQHGAYEIPNVPMGSYRLVASRVGYALRVIPIILTEAGKRKFDIRLHPAPVTSAEVTVLASVPEEWRAQLKRFLPLFLGRSKLASDCHISNPEVLDFTESEDGILSARARLPLEVENQSLGYHISFHLVQFEASRHTSRGIIKVEGHAEFSDLVSADPHQEKIWDEIRSETFKGSLPHFLRSLFRNSVDQEGYVIYMLPRVPVDPSAVHRKSITASQIVHPSYRPYLKELSFDQVLEVEYTRKLPERSYDLVIKKGALGQTSWLTLNYPTITFDSKGCIRNWFPTEVYGYWAWQGLADELPLDYEPGQ